MKKLLLRLQVWWSGLMCQHNIHVWGQTQYGHIRSCLHCYKKQRLNHFTNEWVDY